MILYQYSGGDGIPSLSPPCLKVLMALRRSGAEFEVVNFRWPSQVKKVSPTGRVPVLEIDGRRVADSVAILDELEQRFPQAGLRLEDPVARQRDRLWEHFATDTLYWHGYYLRWIPRDNRDRMMQVILRRVPFFARWAARLIFASRTERRAMAHGIGGKTLEEVTASLERSMELVEVGLAGGPYLQGRQAPGRGDLACASFFVQSGFRHLLPDAERRFRQHPALVEHTVSTLRACGMDPPAWLGTAG